MEEGKLRMQAANSKVSPKPLPQRRNRGKRYSCQNQQRMKELIERANREGERFWRELGVKCSSSDDDDYVESEVEEDEVDSDFDASENSLLEPRGRKKVKAKKVVQVKDKKEVVKKIFIITKVTRGETNGKALNGKKRT